MLRVNDKVTIIFKDGSMAVNVNFEGLDPQNDEIVYYRMNNRTVAKRDWDTIMEVERAEHKDEEKDTDGGMII